MKFRTVTALAVLLGMTACAAEAKAAIKVDSGEHYLEYGFDPFDTDEEIHPEIRQWITSSKGELDADYSEFDPYELGEQTIFLTAETESSEASETLTVIIRDTKAPVIELESDQIYVKKNTNFDPADNIVSVYDEADGDFEPLAFFEAGDYVFVLEEPFEDWGFYLVDDVNVNVTEVGKYEVRITAVDNHGNKTEGKFTVNVTEEEEVHEPNPVSFCDEVKETAEDVTEAVSRVIRDYCDRVGGEFDDTCVVDLSEFFDDESYDEDIDDPYEEDEEYDDWEDEEDPEDWEDEEDPDEWEDEEDPDDWEDEEDEESDPEQDCYNMGGVWYPGDGCAWPDDEDE